MVPRSRWSELAATAAVCDPALYGAGQALARTLRGQGSAGIVCESVRRPAGQCVAVFRPRALSNARAVGHIGLCWNGRAVTHWFEKGAPHGVSEPTVTAADALAERAMSAGRRKPTDESSTLSRRETTRPRGRCGRGGWRRRSWRCKGVISGSGRRTRDAQPAASARQAVSLSRILPWPPMTVGCAMQRIDVRLTPCTARYPSRRAKTAAGCVGRRLDRGSHGALCIEASCRDPQRRPLPTGSRCIGHAASAAVRRGLRTGRRTASNKVRLQHET
jgi:hypothetical protein